MGFDSQEEHGIYCLHLPFIQILVCFFLKAAVVLYCQIIMTLFVFLMLCPEAETGIYLYMLVELHTVLIYKCRDAIS